MKIIKNDIGATICIVLGYLTTIWILGLTYLKDICPFWLLIIESIFLFLLNSWALSGIWKEDTHDSKK